MGAIFRQRQVGRSLEAFESGGKWLVDDLIFATLSVRAISLTVSVTGTARYCLQISVLHVYRVDTVRTVGCCAACTV